MSQPEVARKAQRLRGTVRGLFAAHGDDFVTAPVEELPLTFEGIPGDVHAGHTRRSGGREPWYERGTEMRNERQLSILCEEELAAVAHLMDVVEVKPEWIGANLTLEGVPNLSWLPPRTLLFFEGGVTLKVDGDNMPCRIAGRSIADHYPGREGLDLAFAKEARGRRGVVAWVEKPGTIRPGEAFTASVPPQWVWDAG